MKEAFRVQPAPASTKQIAELQAAVGQLPQAYVAFLLESNGAEWGVTDTEGDCLAMWSAADVLELNEAYQVQRYLPSALAIGSDGGDDALLLIREPAGSADYWPVVRVGFGALDPTEFIPQAPSFAVWAAQRFQLRRPPPPVFPSLG
jgi:hypothetical protein